MAIHSVVIQKLLSTNAHLGRRIAAHHFKIYTYGSRNAMAIMDSDKTLICLRNACDFMGNLIRNKGKFVFVNTNELFDEIIDQMTQKIGCKNDNSWRLSGFLTNSLSPKKFRSRHKKMILGSIQPPDCVVVMDTRVKSSVILEADKLQIPIVGLVDSRMPWDIYKRITYPVPANDSVQFVYLFCNLITKTFLYEQKKFPAALGNATQVTKGKIREATQPIEDSKIARDEIFVLPYESLVPASDDPLEIKKILDKLVVVKSNGDLDTKMGFDGAKSVIEVCNGLTCLDLIVNQIESLNSKYGCNIPLLLINSVNTQAATLKVLEKHANKNIHTLIQSPHHGENDLKFMDSFSEGENSDNKLLPFDHNEVLVSLKSSGNLDVLLSQGKEYILMLNSDNLADVVDPKILNHLIQNNIEYCMEVMLTPSSNMEENALCPRKSKFKLREIARMQDKQSDEINEEIKFTDTTNLWLDMIAISRVVESGPFEKLKSPTLKNFDGAIGLKVPETCYLPVESTSDLLLFQSNLFTCSEGILTRNRTRANSSLPSIELGPEFAKIFAKGVDADTVVLMAARASRVENQDAIDSAIVGMLADPKEAHAGIQEVHFLPFNPTDKRTALTYTDREGKMYRVSKGAPEQILNLAHNKSDIERRVHAVIDKFAERGLRSLAVAYQEVPEGRKESQGGPWQFIGLMPLFDPPRQDSAETIKRALNLGVNVKMITGDQLAIGKETGRRLGMGTNMYPSSALLGQHKDKSIASLPVDELIEKADGFAGVFPEHKYEIVKRLQARKHICGMTGDGVNDAPALKKADIGIAVADATDAARSASDIVLTEPGLSVIISAVLTSRAIFQRMKNYTIYAVSITIRIVVGFMLLALIWKFDFPPFMVLIIAILNDGTIMTISKDRVKPSPLPDSWKLAEIFTTGVILGSYLAMMTVIFFWAAYKTDFFPRTFGVSSLEKTAHDDFRKLASAIYLQVSTISQALIFVTRSRSWSYVERPGLMLVSAFLIAQLIATLIAVYANWSFAAIEGIGWGWAGVIWLYNIVFYIPLDFIKFLIRYALSGRAWDLVIEQRVAFTRKKDFGKEDRELKWAQAQRTLHGLLPPETHFGDRSNFTDLNQIAEEARRRAEMARLRELHTLKGHVESVVKLKNLDINTIQQAYTV